MSVLKQEHSRCITFRSSKVTVLYFLFRPRGGSPTHPCSCFLHWPACIQGDTHRCSCPECCSRCQVHRSQCGLCTHRYLYTKIWGHIIKDMSMSFIFSFIGDLYNASETLNIFFCHFSFSSYPHRCESPHWDSSLLDTHTGNCQRC